MSKTGTLAKVGAVLAAPFPDVELLIPVLAANPTPGVKFVLGILKKGGKRVSEVQSVLFDKAQWAVSDAKKWLKQQGFRIPTADETANFFRFRQKSPARYKEMRTIEAGQRSNPESIPESLTGHLALTSDPFFQEQPPEIQAAMMTGMDLAERVQNPILPRYIVYALPGKTSDVGITQKLRETRPAFKSDDYGEATDEAMRLKRTGMKVWLRDTQEDRFRGQYPPLNLGSLDILRQNPYGSKPWEQIGYHLGHARGGQDRAAVDVNLHVSTGPDDIRRMAEWHIDNQLRLQPGYRESYRPHIVSAFVNGWHDGYTHRKPKMKKPNPAKRKRNPESDAAELSEQFHGRPAEKVTTVIEEIEERTDFTELGDLVELKVATLSGYDVTLQFPESGKKVVKLCSSPDGKQLYFLRGDQSIPLEQIHMGADKWKRDRMILGVLYELTYRTAKGFDKFKVCDYFHKLGEETKEQPMLEYDTLNNKLSVSGGQYHITARGIEN